jgi:SAM-dependent methyltransferase
MIPGTAPQSYQISADDDAVARERERLEALTALGDPHTIQVLTEIGVRPGWHCLEVGAGSGTISSWLTKQVQPEGQVLSIDVDLRFHCHPVPGMHVQHLDVTTDPLPRAAFDLIHARSVLQHLAGREKVLDDLVAAAKPGGWIVIEDSQWQPFLDQPLPEPLASVARIIHAGMQARSGWDPTLGGRLLRMFADRGLVQLEAAGRAVTMRGADQSIKWWALGIEHAAERLLASGAVSREQIEGSLALVRSPDFVMMSPLMTSVRGRVR